jgi:hypothetical protein
MAGLNDKRGNIGKDRLGLSERQVVAAELGKKR